MFNLVCFFNNWVTYPELRAISF